MNVDPRPPQTNAPSGRLAQNIMHFARVLRQAGLPVGPGAVLDALEAVQQGALSRREDFYWALHAVFVKRREHRHVFHQAFEVFWRRPRMFEQLMQMLLQQVQVAAPPKKKQAGQRRLAEAMFDSGRPAPQREQPPGAIEIDAQLTASADEVLRAKDFEQMTAAEEQSAKAAIARMRLHRREVTLRRFRPSAHGEGIDLRRTLRRSMRSGGKLIDLARRERQTREPPLVVLADISGSVSTYSRLFLHFLHALTNDRDRVQVFLFGTRLTNVTREIARRDVDEALMRVSAAVKDWSGGTRIGRCLREFNYRWARRVLGQGAHVLIMTDGLERDDVDLLGEEMARLRRSARRVVWLNPLLRYGAFEARAGGIRAMMPYVDEFRPVHSLDSLEDLAKSLGAAAGPEHDPRRWLQAA